MRCLVLLACGCLIAPVIASAGAVVPNARALGVAEAMLGFCAKADPSAVARQREWIKQLIGEADRKTVADMRHSAEYRHAYDSESGFVAKVESHNIHRLCSELLPGSR